MDRDDRDTASHIDENKDKEIEKEMIDLEQGRHHSLYRQIQSQVTVKCLWSCDRLGVQRRLVKSTRLSQLKCSFSL